MADGATDNWIFLEPFVIDQVLDFFHAGEYLSKVSKAAFKHSFEANKWFSDSCHTFKHEDGGAKMLLKEIQSFLKKKITNGKKEDISKAITYFTNHLHQMNYSACIAKNIPIGSGVIEAACR